MITYMLRYLDGHGKTQWEEFKTPEDSLTRAAALLAKGTPVYIQPVSSTLKEILK